MWPIKNTRDGSLTEGQSKKKTFETKMYITGKSPNTNVCVFVVADFEFAIVKI